MDDDYIPDYIPERLMVRCWVIVIGEDQGSAGELSGRAQEGSLDWKLVGSSIGLEWMEVGFMEVRGPMMDCRTTGRRKKGNVLRVSRVHIFVTQGMIMDIYNKKAVFCLKCILNNFANFSNFMKLLSKIWCLLVLI